jgi:hypothetical protein
LPHAGRIDVSWRIDNGRMTLDVRAPDGIAIDPRLPAGTEGDITVNGTPP